MSCTDTDTHFISASDPISNPNPRKLLTRCTCTILTGSEILLEYMTCSYKISLAEFAMWKKSTNSSDITKAPARPNFLSLLIKKVDK